MPSGCPSVSAQSVGLSTWKGLHFSPERVAKVESIRLYQKIYANDMLRSTVGDRGRHKRYLRLYEAQLPQRLRRTVPTPIIAIITIYGCS